ncbi:hypothetical protein [Xanthomarina sp.]|uniref:hypothetical protein n=1 Tax=Xanthomarina sp. TaxID=1931211 RepID=UPI00257A2709|nr:hypothetical protein [Xanthomarina sp.]
MEPKDYLKDITEIKQLMNKSSRFISLSGLSGVLAGIYAIIGATVAYWLVEGYSDGTLILEGKTYGLVLLDLALIAFLSIATAVVLTTKKAKKQDEKVWDNTSKRLVVNFLIPLLTGGIYILIVLNQQKYGLTAALMLIFYGLALINASKYSIGNIRYLGFIQTILGLICALFPDYGFWIWVLGFGVMHIIYGVWMHIKFDTNY